MTDSANEKFTGVAYSGSVWSGYTNLKFGNSGEATAELTVHKSETGVLHFSIPNFITALPNGTEFNSIEVFWDDKFDGGPLAPTANYWFTGGSTISGTPISSTYGSHSPAGNASAWGLSGTPQAIFSGLKDGSIKFNYKQVGGYLMYGTSYIKEVSAILTYTLADTKRASILVALP